MADSVAIPLTGSAATAASEKTRLAMGTIDLLKSPIAATPGYVFDPADVADYSGYAQAVVTAWGDVYLDPIGGYSFQTYAEFQPTGSGVTNTIYGFVIRAAGGNPEMVVAFGNPVPMLGTSSFVAVLPKFNYQ